MNARTTTYNSAATNRWAVLTEGRLTIREGLAILGQVDVPDAITHGAVYDLIDGYTAPVAEPAPAAVAAPAAPKYQTWFMNKLAENRAMDSGTFERWAYRGYVSYELSMTDGHYAPEPFEAWVSQFRLDPIAELYRGNDNRNPLAVFAREYERGLTRI